MRPIRSALPPREWDVLDLPTSGASTPEISNELVVSLDTVHSHVEHILRKLGVHSREESVARERTSFAATSFSQRGSDAPQASRLAGQTKGPEMTRNGEKNPLARPECRS
jgi:DNA-binding CsgD family transcriptional regulator